MKLSLAVSGVVLVLAAESAGAQTCPTPATVTPSVATSDLFFDDTAPYDAIIGGVVVGPVTTYQVATLRVEAADIDKQAAPNNRNELIFGGNGTAPSVTIIKLTGAQWTPYLCNAGPVQPILGCASTTIPSYSDYLPIADASSGKGSTDCYDFDVADINEDGWLDIVVGRRLDPSLYLAGGERDTVFLNRGPTIGAGADMCTNDYYNLANAFEVPTPAGATTGATFGLALGQIASYSGEAHDHLDLVTCGDDYGIRYFRGNGDGTFTYTLQATYGPLGYQNGTGQSFRHVALEDVEGDGDLDMVVTRLNFVPTWAPSTPVNPNGVWLNQKMIYSTTTGTFVANPSYDPNDPFAFSTQPPLKLPASTQITWVGKPGTCAAGASGAGGTHISCYESAIGDMDGDGDQDLVVANLAGPSAVYLNNGKGFFGSSNSQTGPTDKNDGCPAFVFPPVTAGWSGESQCLYSYFKNGYVSSGQPDPLPCAVSDYVFTMPAEQINVCTGVTLGDVDRDGLPDVAFSNRTTWPEVCVCLGGMANIPVPDVYEYVFMNQSLPGSIHFCSTVERIEGPNDGTSYAEMETVNRDARPDWIDANFSNNIEGEVNHLYWGRELTLSFCAEPHLESGLPPHTGDATFKAHVTVDPDFAGEVYQVLASADQGSFEYGGRKVLLEKDDLTAAMLAAPDLFEGSLGRLDTNAEADISLMIPADFRPKDGTIWLAIVVVDGERIVHVTNVATRPF